MFVLCCFALCEHLLTFPCWGLYAYTVGILIADMVFGVVCFVWCGFFFCGLCYNSNVKI